MVYVHMNTKRVASAGFLIEVHMLRTCQVERNRALLTNGPDDQMTVKFCVGESQQEQPDGKLYNSDRPHQEHLRDKVVLER